MSLILQAPLPLLTTTTVLPSPEFNDSGARQHSMTVHRSIDGTKRTYVKSTARQKLLYTVNLTTLKAIELKAFIKAYYRAQIKLINHKDEVWFVNFTSNPFDFAVKGRGEPGREIVQVTLELEGEQQ